jgi:hypothetical protein
VVAHLGWLNLLKARITGQDGIVESHLREALRIDAENVYANAMIGEWALLPPGNLDEAKAHFATALKSGKAKSFVRGCQLEGMIYNYDPGVPAELIRVANQMRKDNDPISDSDRGRIHGLIAAGTDAELREVISAAPPAEVWATYEWVNPPTTDESDFASRERRFVRANLDEVSGRSEESLRLYRSLYKELNERKDVSPFVLKRVQDAVKRLSI